MSDTLERAEALFGIVEETLGGHSLGTASDRQLFDAAQRLLERETLNGKMILKLLAVRGEVMRRLSERRYEAAEEDAARTGMDW